jgi:hypothetical protein
VVVVVVVVVVVAVADGAVRQQLGTILFIRSGPLCLSIYGNKYNNDSIINDQQLLVHIRVISSRGSQWDIVQ